MGSILSITTINTFINELRDFGITSILIGMDRGFYGSDNMMEFKDYGVIGAIASTVSTADIHGSFPKFRRCTSDMRRAFSIRRQIEHQWFFK
ncbi:MAG: hypothetical protein QW292_13320 [Candidatus Parvarchaeota archaeon]